LYAASAYLLESLQQTLIVKTLTVIELHVWWLMRTVTGAAGAAGQRLLISAIGRHCCIRHVCSSRIVATDHLLHPVRILVKTAWANLFWRWLRLVFLAANKTIIMDIITITMKRNAQNVIEAA
jgi:hypothetical protein